MCWWRRRDIGQQFDGVTRRLDSIDARIDMLERALEQASGDAAHIEYLSHQYAFIPFLPSIAGVLLAIGVLAMSDLQLARGTGEAATSFRRSWLRKPSW